MLRNHLMVYAYPPAAEKFLNDFAMISKSNLEMAGGDCPWREHWHKLSNEHTPDRSRFVSYLKLLWATSDLGNSKTQLQNPPRHGHGSRPPRHDQRFFTNLLRKVCGSEHPPPPIVVVACLSRGGECTLWFGPCRQIFLAGSRTCMILPHCWTHRRLRAFECGNARR